MSETPASRRWRSLLYSRAEPVSRRDSNGMNSGRMIDAIAKASEGKEKNFQDVFEAILNSGGGKGWAREVQFVLVDPKTGDLLKHADGTVIRGQADFMRNNNGLLEVLELKTATGQLRENQKIYQGLIQAGDAEVQIVNRQKARKLCFDGASQARGGSRLATMEVLRPDSVRRLLASPKISVSNVARSLYQITGRRLFQRTLRVPGGRPGGRVPGRRFVAREGGSLLMAAFELEDMAADWLLQEQRNTLFTIQRKGAAFGYDSITKKEHAFAANMGATISRKKVISWGDGPEAEYHLVPGRQLAAKGTEVLGVTYAANASGTLDFVRDFTLTLLRAGSNTRSVNATPAT